MLRLSDFKVEFYSSSITKTVAKMAKGCKYWMQHIFYGWKRFKGELSMANIIFNKSFRTAQKKSVFKNHEQEATENILIKWSKPLANIEGNENEKVLYRPRLLSESVLRKYPSI